MTVAGYNIERRARECIRPLFCWNALWLALFFIGIGIFMIGMPRYGDDYWYMTALRPWFEAQGIRFPGNGGNVFAAGIPWDCLADTWQYRFYNDNIRLCNMVAPFELLFPKWLGSGLMLLVWIYAVVRMSSTCGISLRRSALVPYMLAALTFFMPWYDTMGSEIFQINYVVSCGIAVAVTSYLVRGARCRGNSRGLWRTAAAFFIGFGAGWWQESFAVPLLAGAAVNWVLFRQWRNARTLAAGAGLAAGLLILATSPGIHNRFDNVEKVWDIWRLLHFMGIESVVAVTMLVTAACLILFSRRRRRLRDGLLVFFVVNVVVQFVVLLPLHQGRRVYFWSYFCAIFSMALLLVKYRDRFWSRYTLRSAIPGALLLVAVFAHWACVDYYSLRFRKFSRELLADNVARGGDFFWADIHWLERMPLICLQLPDYRFWFTCMGNTHAYYGFDGKYGTDIYPVQLRRISARSGVPVDGDARVRQVDGYYVIHCDDEVLAHHDFEFIYASGATAVARLSVFQSEGDGRYYLWLYPMGSYIQGRYGSIVGIKLKDEK